MILADPELAGVASVLFDEFHERSLDADLGLALARDAQGGLRDDLRILAMSATLDGARVARLLGDAPVIESQGRMFPVETRYLGRDAGRRIEEEVAAPSLAALERESRARSWSSCPARARSCAPRACWPSGSGRPAWRSRRSTARLDPRDQDRAILPAPAGRRKVVLATSIAETSLTIEGVRVVIDSGLARVPRYEPASGLTRLATVRVSRAAADQRRGRAGRTEPGRLLSPVGGGGGRARWRPTPSRRSSPPTSRPSSSTARPGACGTRTTLALARPAARARPQPRRGACSPDLGALDADGRLTRGRAHALDIAAAAAAGAHGRSKAADAGRAIARPTSPP